jgi:hypothetical protein
MADAAGFEPAGVFEAPSVFKTDTISRALSNVRKWHSEVESNYHTEVNRITTG